MTAGFAVLVTTPLISAMVVLRSAAALSGLSAPAMRPLPKVTAVGEDAHATPVTASLGNVPGGNPAVNVAPSPDFLQSCSGTSYDDSQGCLNATLAAIAHARAPEGLAGMALPTNWASLSPQQQIYVATNLERTARGLPPLSAMASALDGAAAAGAQSNSDPAPPPGFPFSSWGSNWAAAVGNPLEAIYFWMYDDGQGSSNIDCTPTNTSGCWGHRDNILMSLACGPCDMGTGYAPGAWQGKPGWTELLVGTSGAPALDYTWNQVLAFLPSGGVSVADPDLFEFISDHANGRVWNAYDQSANTHGPGMTGSPSAVVDPSDGLVRVFQRGSDNHLIEYVDDQVGGRTWNYYDLTAAYGVLDIAGNPNAVADAGDGHIHVFERASDGHLLEYVNDGVNGHAWNPHDLTAVSGNALPLAADPHAVFDTAQGTVHVYAQGSGGNLVEYVDDHAGGRPWNAYDVSGYAGGGSPVAGTPGPVYDAAQNLIHTYVEGSNGHLMEYVSDHANGNIWNGYDLSVYAGGGSPIAAAPTGVYDGAQGLIHIFAQGSNGHLIEYVSDHANGHVWNAYDLSAYAGGGGPISATPSGVYDGAQGLIHIFAQGSNGHLIEYISDHANGNVWNAYDQTAGATGPSVEGTASPVVLGSVIHIYVGGT